VLLQGPPDPSRRFKRRRPEIPTSLRKDIKRLPSAAQMEFAPVRR